MKEISLTQGKIALVDDEDYDREARLEFGKFAALNFAEKGEQSCL